MMMKCRWRAVLFWGVVWSFSFHALYVYLGQLRIALHWVSIRLPCTSTNVYIAKPRIMSVLTHAECFSSRSVVFCSEYSVSYEAAARTDYHSARQSKVRVCISYHSVWILIMITVFVL